MPSAILHSIHPARVSMSYSVTCIGQVTRDGRFSEPKSLRLHSLPGFCYFLTPCRAHKRRCHVDSNSSWVLDPAPCLFAFIYFFCSSALSFPNFIEDRSQMSQPRKAPRVLPGSSLTRPGEGALGGAAPQEVCRSFCSAVLPSQALGSSTHSLGKLEEGH